MMPTINQNTSIAINPERFISCCSDNELQELDLLMQSRSIDKRLKNAKASAMREVPNVLPVFDEDEQSATKLITVAIFYLGEVRTFKFKNLGEALMVFPEIMNEHQFSASEHNTRFEDWPTQEILSE